MKKVNFKQTAYGQWLAITTYYGKEISMHFTDAQIIDIINSKERGWKRIEKLLKSRIIQENK